MKCQIQWIDASGKPTPDENDAVMIAHCHKQNIRVINMSRGQVVSDYQPKIAQSFGICQAHLDRVESRMRYGNGGAWSFSEVEK